MIPKRRVLAAILGALLLSVGSSLLARASWVEAKGAVAEILIHRALAATLEDGNVRRPWSWADMHPVARLVVPRLDVERAVLSNASGSALAFGIGHVDGTSEPGDRGHVVLAGHRDSWAAFLFDLRAGDEVVVHAPGQRTRTYVVRAIDVVRSDDVSVLHDTVGDRLTLVTCWPARGWLRSPWRLVVRAQHTRGSSMIEFPPE